MKHAVPSSIGRQSRTPPATVHIQMGELRCTGVQTLGKIMTLPSKSHHRPRRSLQPKRSRSYMFRHLLSSNGLMAVTAVRTHQVDNE